MLLWLVTHPCQPTHRGLTTRPLYFQDLCDVKAPLKSHQGLKGKDRGLKGPALLRAMASLLSVSHTSGLFLMFLVPVTNYLTTSTLKGEGLISVYSSSGDTVIPGKAGRQEFEEAAGHFVHTGQKHREMNADSQGFLFVLFCFVCSL